MSRLHAHQELQAEVILRVSHNDKHRKVKRLHDSDHQHSPGGCRTRQIDRSRCVKGLKTIVLYQCDDARWELGFLGPVDCTLPPTKRIIGIARQKQVELHLTPPTGKRRVGQKR